MRREERKKKKLKTSESVPATSASLKSNESVSQVHERVPALTPRSSPRLQDRKDIEKARDGGEIDPVVREHQLRSSVFTLLPGKEKYNTKYYAFGSVANEPPKSVGTDPKLLQFPCLEKKQGKKWRLHQGQIWTGKNLEVQVHSCLWAADGKRSILGFDVEHPDDAVEYFPRQVYFVFN